MAERENDALDPDPNKALAWLLKCEGAGLLDKSYIRRSLDEGD